MEVAGLVIGLSGLIAVGDKALAILQIVSDIHNFGDDMAEILFQLAHESLIFHDLVSLVSSNNQSSGGPLVPDKADLGSGPEDDLRISTQKHLANAFSRLQIGLERAEAVLKKYGLLDSDLDNSTTVLEPIRLSSTAKRQKQWATSLRDRIPLRRKIEFEAGKPWSGTPADKQTLADAVGRMRYWNQAVISLLSMAQRLEVHENVRCQFMAGWSDDDDSLLALQSFSVGDPELQASAALLRKRHGLENGQTDPDSLNNDSNSGNTTYKSSSSSSSPFFQNWNDWAIYKTELLGHVQGQQYLACRQATAAYRSQRPARVPPQAASANALAVVDWISYSQFSESEKQVAQARVERLCELLQFERKPRRLGTLSGLGFVNDIVRRRWGILLEVPKSGISSRSSSPPASSADIHNGTPASGTGTMIGPISLYELLSMARSSNGSSSHNKGTTTGRSTTGSEQGKTARSLHYQYKPDLGQRFQMARRLAQTFLELHKVRWLHKGFDSRMAIFFFGQDQGGDDSPGPQENPPQIMFADPFVTGFAFSRPSGREHVSLPVLSSTAGFEVYMHPDLLRTEHAASSTTPIPPPRYKPAYDIYSLSVVLLEIGLWAPIQSLPPLRTTSTTDTPPEVTRKLTRLATSNLGHAMGTKYRDAVIAGLHWVEGCRPENGYEPGADESQVAMVDVQRMFWEIVQPLEECACGSRG